MKTDDFNYALDPSRIAQTPIAPRDHSKLMVLSRHNRHIQHRHFRDLPTLLDPGDTLVINDTAVIPVRLIGRKQPSGGRIDCCLIKETSLNIWEVFIRGRVRVGQEIEFPNTITATVTPANPETTRKCLTFNGTHNLRDQLFEIGLPPLPPYIKRTPDAEDLQRYQTVYAKVPGAIAAPTAGLHFTSALLQRLRDRQVTILNVTLHTGLGTFLPVHTIDVNAHHMEPEWFQVSPETLRAIRKTKIRGGRVIAVGTTAVKALETVVQHDASEEPHSGETALFIYPGFQFQTVDALITNFHLPRTTLLMLVCAFAEKAFVLQAYEKAMDNGYRFYSYGDAMLIL
ncbi:MAG TPA: tRNA preQ1(34) S-adenosylmethionine ribosyltransferase-isomerase QueA [Nitrospirales bacterium]|nr:tRNA preQ1(34) S-adenosylmethionine ribosyltransferase-isomerase QueA [Nitrospirales bacterium]HIO20937.1 tRNA preQ1(34) S-adenosylmethionine ribosyltransferase-isomerase QueA [Nitrospirales bacterium]